MGGHPSEASHHIVSIFIFPRITLRFSVDQNLSGRSGKVGHMYVCMNSGASYGRAWQRLNRSTKRTRSHSCLHLDLYGTSCVPVRTTCAYALGLGIRKRNVCTLCCTPLSRRVRASPHPIICSAAKTSVALAQGLRFAPRAISLFILTCDLYFARYSVAVRDNLSWPRWRAMLKWSLYCRRVSLPHTLLDTQEYIMKINSHVQMSKLIWLTITHRFAMCWTFLFINSVPFFLMTRQDFLRFSMVVWSLALFSFKLWCRSLCICAAVAQCDDL